MITLQEILQAREERVLLQKRLLQQYGCPLVCFTMNIAGPVKTSPLIEWGFRSGLAALRKALPWPLQEEVRYLATGCEAYLSVQMPAEMLKELCVQIEEATPLGRLFDMDVLDTDGQKLQRKTERGCLVCGKPGRACAARRLHSVEELQAATEQILVAELAVESLLAEANATPKPGLVDRNNNGSHKDMCLQTFVASANALRPYFSECVAIGQQTAQQTPQDTFRHLRLSGIRAENAMLESTGGVNTHKGAIFTLGILCGCIGRLSTYEISAILAEAALMGKAAEEDFALATGDTAGERLYLQRKLRGIRGEVADGLPSVAQIGLPMLHQALAQGLTEEQAAACALLYLIAHVEDTNLYHRGGEEGVAFARKAVQTLLMQDPFPTEEMIKTLDNAFIERNLSPGGCADLLAATLFLHNLKKA
jgi:holo-ACP synthase/triphosphoribosyl-dephospho-CoA synthase